MRDATFDEIESFGVHWIRVILYWHDVAPQPGPAAGSPDFDQTDPAAYPASGWAPYDRIVQEAERRGIRVLLTVSGPVPKWATLCRRSTVKFPSALRFGRFVQAVGTRYGPQIDYWSVWNEPNHPQFLGPQWVRGKPYAPRIYRRLFRAARKGLRRSGNRRDRVLMGETAPNGSGRIILPLRFLRGALCLNKRYKMRTSCNKLDVDGWAHHPYTTRRGPRYARATRDAVMIGTLSRLRRALDRAARAGAIRTQRRHLPDRVRHPEQAGPDLRRVADPAGRVAGGGGADRLPQLARARLLAVPDARRREAGPPLRRLRVRPALPPRAQRRRPTAPSGCR